VAYAVGFSDEKTFSRAFKRRFGFLPRDAGAHGLQPAGADQTPVLLSWINALVS
jgi:AraC-like DNA-binding protein